MTKEEEWEEQFREGKITHYDLDSLKKSQQSLNEMDELMKEKK